MYRRTEKRPFESWTELDAHATELGARYGRLVISLSQRAAALHAATGLAGP